MLPPTGPFLVGCQDFTWRSRSDAPIDGQNHACGRLFYPAAPDNVKAPSGGIAWPVTWLKSMKYAEGYVTFAFFNAKSLKWRIAKKLMQGVVWASGMLTHMPVKHNAPMAEARPDPFPLVIFSPGAAANRNTYSATCIEMASRGCVVASIEHADGSSGAAQLADGSWKMFAGLGTGPVLESKCDYRVDEVMSVVEIMGRLNEGCVPNGIFALTGRSPEAFKGSMDLSKLTVMGHSCGGATAVLAASRHPELAAAVALDPWWPILPSGSPALTQWLPGCCAPLLIIGSDDWNTPKVDGTLACNGERQEQVLQAARRRTDGAQGASGGGTVFMVPSHSKHHTFSDVPALIESSRVARGLLKAMGFGKQALSAAAALRLICECAARFCRAHYDKCGAWPVEGCGDGQAEAEAAAAEAEAAAGRPGAGAAGGVEISKVEGPKAQHDGDFNNRTSSSSSSSDGIVTDKAKELGAEERARRHLQQQQQQQHAGSDVDGGDQGCKLLPHEQQQQQHANTPEKATANMAMTGALVTHIPISRQELGAYSQYHDEGLLRKLEAIE